LRFVSDGLANRPGVGWCLSFSLLRVISCGLCPTDWSTDPGQLGCFLFSLLRGESLSEAPRVKGRGVRPGPFVPMATTVRVWL